MRIQIYPMTIHKFISLSEEDTQNFAYEFVCKLSGGDVIGIKGDLGAGKTLFVKAAAEALGVVEPVTSPSFSLRKEYSAHHDFIKKLIHIDLYRLQDVSHEEGFFENISDTNVVTFIEWPERLKENNLIKRQIIIDIISENERSISVN